MNIFKSDSAPFVLALIVSALGWYVAELSNDLRRTRTAIYSVHYGHNRTEMTVSLQNLSRTEALQGAEIIIFCDGDLRIDASVQNSSEVVTVPPHRPLEQTRLGDDVGPGQEAYKVGVAPGGSIGMTASIPNCASELDFTFRQMSASPFYITSSSSLEGIIGKHYSSFLIVGFAILALGLAGWILVNLVRMIGRGSNVTQPADSDRRLDVFITVVD